MLTTDFSVCVCVFLYAHGYGCPWGSEITDLLGLEFHTAVSHLPSVLGAKLKFSGREKHALNF